MDDSRNLGPTAVVTRERGKQPAERGANVGSKDFKYSGNVRFRSGETKV